MAKVLTSVPRKPARFPPAGAAREHRVATGDNWWSLAATHGRGDPWDIIEFNFRSRDPREVNWYMESYLGCRFPSPDGNNYRFDSSDEPGLVYIPPPSWKPSEDLRLRRMVAFALAGPVVARTSVTHAGHTVTGSGLAAIGIRVLDGDIDVVVDPALKSGEAEYDADTGVLHLGFSHASTDTRKGLIVHEAVHALLDARAAAGLSVAESESLAYVVQSFYVYELTADPTTTRLTDSNPFKDRVYELAWDMAAQLSRGTQPGPLEWLALDHAVRRHPKYRKTAGSTAIYDGI
jgi:hypothetical protein